MTIAPERPTKPRSVHDLPKTDPDWDLQAACRDADFSLFVVHSDNSRGLGNRNRLARRLCASCPVQLDCRITACQEDDRRSIRGGMAPIERDEWLGEQGIRRPGALAVVLPGQSKRQPYRSVNIDRLLSLYTANVSQREIADALGCTLETVQRRLKAARAEGLIP